MTKSNTRKERKHKMVMLHGKWMCKAYGCVFIHYSESVMRDKT